MKFKTPLIFHLIFIFSLSHFLTFSLSLAQTSNPPEDKEATDLLQRVSNKYKAYKNIAANFQLLTQQPKIQPTDDERKLTDTLNGHLILQGDKFKLKVKQQEVICDGKNIWTYTPEDKEVQVNYFEESDDIFSPSKIFSLYKEGYLYAIKEKIEVKGRAETVIEVAPNNKKATYFKIDLTIDSANLQIVQSKVYEKNGIRYIYKLTKQTFNIPTSDETFTFDTKKYPGVKVVDLR